MPVGPAQCLVTAFFSQLAGHFHAFDADPNVRAVVIRAEGPSFAAGLDFMAAGSLLAGTGAGDREALRKTILALQQGISAVEQCRTPVIAAVHGHCIGGGVDLLAACDIRLAAADAVFSIRESRLAYVAQKNAAALFSGDLTEAVAAFAEKRAPVFRGR